MTLSETHVVRQYVSYLDELVQNCRIIAHTWERYVDELLRGDHANSYRAAGIRTGRRGRPPFSITREQLEYLQSMSFTWSEIGSILGVSRKKLQLVQTAANAICDAMAGDRNNLYQNQKPE